MKYKYLVCIDSDGCAIDSMNSKHMKCFGPAFVKVWHQEADCVNILERWNDINLYSATRGINRFKGLALILKEFLVESEMETKRFIAWTEEALELSNVSLEKMCQKDSGVIFKRAMEWSLLVNELIEKLPVPSSFPFVSDAFGKIKEAAAIAVVSSANKEAIQAEWEENGLLSQVDYLFSQSEGSKSQCIGKMIKKGYLPEHILMIGDAPGDYQAARENGVKFYPILAGKESQSWQKLLTDDLERFFTNHFDQNRQMELIEQMKINLRME